MIESTLPRQPYAMQKSRTIPMGNLPGPARGTPGVVRHFEAVMFYLMELQRRADEKAKLKNLPWHLINDAGIPFEELKKDLRVPFWRFPDRSPGTRFRRR